MRPLALTSCLLLLACQASSAIGARCATSSECASPLVCRSGRCRTECVANRDCPIGARCLLIAGTGTCALDDDVCSGASTCGGGLICVAGECVNACATLVECPPDSTCDSSGSVAHCVPGAPLDGAIGDGGAGGVTIVAVTYAVAAPSGGNVIVVPPEAARPGDRVLLLLDRYATASPIADTIGQGWMRLASQNIVGDAQEAAVRVAAADEGTNAARYTFPATDSADWMLIVLRGASAVRSLRSNAGTSPYVYSAASAAAGALVIDAVATDVATPCSPTPTSAAYAEGDLWHLLPIPIDASLSAASATLTCHPLVGAMFQLVADP